MRGPVLRSGPVFQNLGRHDFQSMDMPCKFVEKALKTLKREASGIRHMRVGCWMFEWEGVVWVGGCLVAGCGDCGLRVSGA